MSTIRINDKESLSRFLNALVDESVDRAKSTLNEDYGQALQREADDERDKQEKAKSDVDSLFGGGDEKAAKKKGKRDKGDEGDDELGLGDMDLVDMGGEEEEVDTSDAAEQAAKTVTVTDDVNGVVELLNLIRSGRSLKKADVLDELTKWVNQMSDSEQLALVTFLSGLKDIVTAGESAEEAEEPEDNGVQISSEKDEEVQSQSPGGNKGDLTGEAPKVSQVTSVEDTTAPIKVGLRNEAYIREYRAKIKKLIAD